MSTPVLVLLSFLVLSACQGHWAAPLQTSTLLKESIRLLSTLLESEVSCDTKNVTNIFAGNKKHSDMELLCKATTVTWEHRVCHRYYLEGVSFNLLQLVQRKGTVPKVPCPVEAGNTTSLREFLGHLRLVLQRLLKEEILK